MKHTDRRAARIQQTKERKQLLQAQLLSAKGKDLDDIVKELKRVDKEETDAENLSIHEYDCYTHELMFPGQSSVFQSAARLIIPTLGMFDHDNDGSVLPPITTNEREPHYLIICPQCKAVLKTREYMTDRWKDQ